MSIFNKSPKNEQPKTEGKESIFTKETLGVVLILFATLCLVCLITRESVFAGVGKAVNSFLFGCFGYFAYLVLIGCIYFGVVCISDKRLQLSKKIKVFLSLSIICLAMLLHVITMRNFSGSYGEYIKQSYLKATEGGIATSSAGGLFVGLVAYVFPAVLQGFIPSVVVLSVLLVVCAYMLGLTIYKSVGAQEQKTTTLRTSYVQKETPIAVEPPVQVQGEKEYPINDAIPEQSNGSQKLFVVNAHKDDFRQRNKAKDAQTNNLKIDFTQGGLGVASTPTTYTKEYTADIKSKLEYIKTPATINVESSKNDTYYNFVNKSNQPAQPSTTVSDYIVPNPTVKKVDDVNQLDSQVKDIPFYEHQTPAVKDDAISHSERFSSFAEFEETSVQNVNVTPDEMELPFEQSVQNEQPTVEIEPIAHLEQADEVFAEQNEQTTKEQSITDENVQIEDKPQPSTITRDRVRNIFTAETKEEISEKPSYTSRVEADNNQSSVKDDFIMPSRASREGLSSANSSTRIMGFGQPQQSQPQPQQEEQKPQKVAPPINREYFRPPLDLLQKYEMPADAPQDDHQQNMEIIKQTLEDFHINVGTGNFVQGPSITRYEISMPPGTSVKRVLGYDDDLKMRLSSKEGIRIEAPIPGKNLVGIEVANKVPKTVGLREVLEKAAQKETNEKPGSLMFALGKDIVGNAITDNLAKGPHYLVAGATGSGKSVCLNTMIVSLIMRYSPEELRLFLVDPKGVEFATYEHLPHLMIDEIITAPQKAIEMLKWAYDEMQRRFLTFRECNSGIVNIDDYNSMVASDTIAKMPRIVIIIDELADLMQTCKKDLEARICAIAQKARSAGIHLVLATQRPSVDVITGTIKANLPSRIAFKVMNFNDSQTILSEAGAEKLLGNGDMLYKNAQMPSVARYQGAYINMREVNNVVNYIKEHNVAYFDDELQQFLENATNPQPEINYSNEGGEGSGNSENNDLLIRALWFGINNGSISISSMQRHFGIGFSRAGGLMDKMDKMGLVSQNEGSKARRIIISREEFEERFGAPPQEEY